MSIAFAQSPTTTPRPQKLFTSPLDRNRLQIVHISDFTRSNARRFVRDERKSPRLRIRVFPSGESIDGSPQREASGELSLDAILSMTFLLLVGSVAIGSLIRRRQWRRICRESENAVGVDLLARIEKVEDDMRSSATIVRVLSRQLDKLGIRFRITRKALKEPIAESAALAQQNSQAMRALALQEDILEKELGEIQKVLLAMQEQQQKQLDLILAIGKAGRLFENKRATALPTDRAATTPVPGDESKQLERRTETTRHNQ